MFDCFLLNNSKVIVNRDTNEIYLTTLLRRITLNITDKDGKFLSLGNLGVAIFPAAEKAWSKDEFWGVVSGALQVVLQVPTPTPALVNLFNVSFIVGALFERLRKSKDLTFSVTTDEISSQEVDEVQASFNKELEENQENDFDIDLPGDPAGEADDVK